MRNIPFSITPITYIFLQYVSLVPYSNYIADKCSTNELTSKCHNPQHEEIVL